MATLEIIFSWALKTKNRVVGMMLIVLVISALIAINVSLVYPRKVIAYGLNDASSSLEIVLIIRKWKHDKWGAQVGALRTLCLVPWGLDGIVGDRDQKIVCRIAH